jgi:hypothetical protein
VSAFGVHDPGGNGVPFVEVWAWVTVHSPLEQSITAVMLPGMGSTPLVFQQEHVARAPRTVELLQQVARETGKAQRLVHLASPTTVDEISPGGRS